ncbi:SurA N-terminal domain-containing protein [Litchfieldia salsa]|uniref:SurA N-terminal domain-containing protein n=1 Tax=Litchfieldia salsa TaxID=930152 RepID=A0A1H0WSW7_9BACI|nr:SurA N-terminal domain-containing protein [Litchfieldia salsa]SDP93615.1 SurA N-terminal domain-containing protein [Litchfieldia salsa]
MLHLKRKATLLVLVLILVLTGCGNNGEEATDKSTNKESNDQKEVVASVNGKNISQTEFNTALEQFKLTYTQQGIDLESLGEEQNKLIEEQALEQLINNELLQQAADKEELVAKPEEVEASLSELKGQFETEDQFTEALATNNLTLEELEEQIAKEMKINQYIASNINEQTVTDEEIQEMYDMYGEQSEEELPALEEVKEQIKQTIEQQKQQQEIQVLIEKLKEDSKIIKNI